MNPPNLVRKGKRKRVKKLLRVLSGEALSPPPVWMMRQAGRYLPEYREVRKTAVNFLDFCYSPELAVEVTLQPIRKYGFDASILFSDILVIPDALGQKVEFQEGVGPVLGAIQADADIDALDADRVLDHLAPVFETVTRLRNELPRETALIGFAGSPWTVAFYMFEGRSGKDGATLKEWAYSRSEAFERVIDILVGATTDYLCAQAEAGAEALQLFDSWAGVASEDLFARYIIRPTKRIVDSVRARHPSIPIIGFPRQAGALYGRYAHETGVNGIGVDPQTPLGWIKDQAPPGCALQGNLDNILLAAGGAGMDAAVNRLLDEMEGTPFIFNLGHGIIPKTPPGNVSRVLDVIRARG